MHDIDYRGIFQSRGCRMPSHLAVCGTYEGQWWGCWKAVERIVSELWFQLSWVKFAYLKRRDCVERILLLCFFSLLVFFLERIMQQVVAFFFFFNESILLQPQGCLQVIVCSWHHICFWQHHRNHMILCPGWKLLTVVFSPWRNELICKRCFCVSQIMSSKNLLAWFLHSEAFSPFYIGLSTSRAFVPSQEKLSQHHRATSGLSWRFSKKGRY